MESQADLYEYVDYLGKGAEGVVELVRRKTDGEEFAMKIVCRASKSDMGTSEFKVKEKRASEEAEFI